MPKIFISYRRAPDEYPAQSIYEALVAQFGEGDVFFDRNDIPPGAHFPAHLNAAVAKCDVLLAIIGDYWLNAQDGQGQRRLDDPNDLVWLEIEAALSRNILVVPVLVGKAAVPQARELDGERPPSPVRARRRRRAASIRSGGLAAYACFGTSGKESPGLSIVVA